VSAAGKCSNNYASSILRLHCNAVELAKQIAWQPVPTEFKWEGDR